MTAEASSPLVEIRIPGVGDQNAFSALAAPLSTPVNDWVEVTDPPMLPDHELRILDWSRSNQRRTRGVAWYAALPFTLANFAARMTPADGGGGRLLGATVNITGLLLTVSQFAWLTVLLETILRNVPAFAPAGITGRAVPLLAAAALIGWLVYRWETVVQRQAGTGSPAERPPHWLYAGHLAAIIASGLAAAFFPPAQLDYSGWPSIPTPLHQTIAALVQPQTVPRLDAMAALIIVTIVPVLLAAVGLAVFYWLAPPQRRAARASLVIAGGILLTAIVLMHAVSALVRMAVDELIHYLASLFWPQSEPALTSVNNTLLGLNNPGVPGDSRLDLFPFQALVLLAAVALATAVMAQLSPGLSLAQLFSDPVTRARWYRKLVLRLPQLLPAALPLGALAGAGICAWLITTLDVALGSALFGLGVLLLQLGAAVVILSSLLGQFPRIRAVLAKAADVAGFWPVHDHPLAGISYREPVLAGILAEINHHVDQTVVLAGHSQGSVLAAWLLAGRAGVRPVPPVHLVTCGSPLHSLYSAAFPAYFPARFFADTAAGSASWANFWRDTDPVATPVDGALNVQLQDPDPSGILRGHFDYWSDPQMAAYISGLGGAGPVSATGARSV